MDLSTGIAEQGPADAVRRPVPYSEGSGDRRIAADA